MKFKPNPLLYGANEDFFSTFRLAIRMKDTVDYEILSHAVEKVMARYPYFCVFPEREDENLVLQYNKCQLPVFPDDRTVTLGSEASNGHLISFGCKNNTIFIDDFTDSMIHGNQLNVGVTQNPISRLKNIRFNLLKYRYNT